MSILAWGGISTHHRTYAGGWITDDYNWHWIFLINIPVGAVALILTSIFVHDPPFLVRRSLRDGMKIDYIVWA